MAKELIIGVDLGGTNIKAGVVSLRGKVQKRIKVPTESGQGGEKVMENIKKTVHQLLNGLDKENILGIGMGTPGVVDLKTGVLLGGSENLPGWAGTPIKPELEKEFSLPSFADNDVNVVTLGEHWQGAGKGIENLFCLTLGTGIGGGIVINGKLYRGSGYYAGEVGHTTINFEGLACNCGSFGCLETYGSSRAIAHQCLSAIQNKKVESNLLSLVDDETEKVNTGTVVKAATEGDRLCQAVIAETARALGAGIANVINLLNPQMVIVGGGVSKAGDILLRPLREQIQRYALPIAYKTAKIVRAELGDAGGIVGSAALVMEQLGLAKI